MADLNKYIGQQVRRRREELGLSQQQLANLARAQGASTLYQPRIADIEDGRRDVRARELVALSRALEVAITWLLGVPDRL